MWCWGRNDLGQLGRGVSSGAEHTAGKVVVDPTSFTAVQAGGDRACAISGTEQVFCWGADLGCLGCPRDDPDPTPSPSMIPDVSDARSVALGAAHVCIHRGGGDTVHCQGATLETVGRGDSPDPADSTELAAVAGGFPTPPVELSARGNFTCALRADDVALCWGDNFQGQLGTGDRSDKNVPAPLARPLF